ncbi:MAG: amino acid permease [Bacteroidetes bacterium]|nr:amino acid permease [Bacteroidota bacterium]
MLGTMPMLCNRHEVEVSAWRHPVKRDMSHACHPSTSLRVTSIVLAKSPTRRHAERSPDVSYRDEVEACSCSPTIILMTQLKRALSRFDLTMIAIGGTIGSGIFLTPSLIARNLESPVLILGVWVIGGLMALAGSLTFAELGGMMPGSGGVYVYLSQTYGKLFGFLYGWAYLLVVNTGGIAALSIAFATYLGFFIPLGAAGIKVVAILGLVFLTVLNVMGVKAGGMFSNVFTILKLAGIAGIIVIGFGWGSTSVTDFTALSNANPSGLLSALAVAMVGVLWSYGGWQHASYTAGEAKEPERSVPFAMVVGALIVAFIYVTINIAYMLLLSPAAIGNSSRVAAGAVGTIFGPTGGSLIAVAIFISTFGTAGIYTLTAPRIYYAMATDGIFFKQIATVHPRFKTPANAIVLQSTWAIILILFWGTFENLISYVVFTDWIFFGLAASCVLVLRRKLPEAQRPYRTLGYPFTPLFFVLLAGWFVVNTLVEKPEQAWAGIIFLALGVPVYYYWSGKSSNNTENGRPE